MNARYTSKIIGGACATLFALAVAGCARENEPQVSSQDLSSPVTAAEPVAPAVPSAVPDVTLDATVDESVKGPLPTTVRGWVNEGRRAMDGGEFEDALFAADRALELDKDSAQGHHVRGRALLALNRAEEALEELGKARELAPDNGYIANTLGYALIQSGRAADALPHLLAARERLPQLAYVRNNLGVAYERTGDRGQAIAEYMAAVEAGDSEGKAARSLARLGEKTPVDEHLAATTERIETDSE